MTRLLITLSLSLLALVWAQVGIDMFVTTAPARVAPREFVRAARHHQFSPQMEWRGEWGFWRDGRFCKLFKKEGK